MDRVLFDTVVFVRALINPQSPCGRLVFHHPEDYLLTLSRPVIDEILEVLARPEVSRRFRSFAGLDIPRVLALIGLADIVDVAEILPVSRGPRDGKFLATARAAQAEYLVSEDRDLLDLVEYEGTRIVTCIQLLEILEHGEV